jgi:hypothetical protein
MYDPTPGRDAASIAIDPLCGVLVEPVSVFILLVQVPFSSVTKYVTFVNNKKISG